MSRRVPAESVTRGYKHWTRASRNSSVYCTQRRVMVVPPPTRDRYFPGVPTGHESNSRNSSFFYFSGPEKSWKIGHWSRKSTNSCQLWSWNPNRRLNVLVQCKMKRNESSTDHHDCRDSRSFRCRKTVFLLLSVFISAAMCFLVSRVTCGMFEVLTVAFQ